MHPPYAGFLFLANKNLPMRIDRPCPNLPDVSLRAEARAQRRNTRSIFANLALAVIVNMGLPWPMVDIASAQPAKPADASAMVPDFQRLDGRWARSDGGYVLELRNIQKDGSVTAGYFNPRPIRVATANLGRKDGKITVFVELRDVNYPGSTYTLQYDAAADRLKGTYFQAVEKQNFAVEFARTR
jgi:hypothetical protein